MYTVIDGNCFKNMLVGAYQLFQKKYEIINQLNVFPCRMAIQGITC